MSIPGEGKISQEGKTKFTRYFPSNENKKNDFLEKNTQNFSISNNNTDIKCKIYDSSHMVAGRKKKLAPMAKVYTNVMMNSNLLPPSFGQISNTMTSLGDDDKRERRCSNELVINE